MFYFIKFYFLKNTAKLPGKTILNYWVDCSEKLTNDVKKIAELYDNSI